MIDTIKPFLEQNGFLLSEYGYEVVINQLIRDRLNSDAYKTLNSDGKFVNPAAMMTRYSPDYFITHRSANHDEPEKKVFFIEFKLTLTPIYKMSSWHRKTGNRLPDVTPCDIGDIEREAWDVYNQCYPPNQVCLIIGSSYHPRFLVADWITNISELFRDNRIRNPYAEGSTTPHVNIDLGGMRTLRQFLEEEFQIEIDSSSYDIVVNTIRGLEIKRWSGVSDQEYNTLVAYIRRGCH